MPSLAELGGISDELAGLGRSLDFLAEGETTDLTTVEANLRGLDRARRAYERLPEFPGEPEEVGRARPLLEAASRAAFGAMAAVRAGDLPRARASYLEDYLPAAKQAEVSLRELRRINLEEGSFAGRRADAAMDHERTVSIALDAACVIFTAALAALAVVLLRRALDAEAKRADELDAFAARVAHDLRGPLSTPLLVLQQLAKQGSADPRQRLFVEKGLRGLKRADSLIGDLLMYARAAAAPEPGAVASLAEAVSGAMQDAEREAAAANVHIDVADIPPRAVCCPPGVLSSIVENLVGNAIKYMPADRQPRRVCIRAQDGIESVRVEVSDTGAGIPAELQRNIFEPYVRGRSGRPGLGLGLATVKRLVQSHGGKLGVRSEPGTGSVFWFELPARAA